MFGSTGYFFARDLPLLEMYISRAGFGVLIVGAALVPLFIFYIRRKGATNYP